MAWVFDRLPAVLAFPKSAVIEASGVASHQIGVQVAEILIRAFAAGNHVRPIIPIGFEQFVNSRVHFNLLPESPGCCVSARRLALALTGGPRKAG
jgi:hypothetical protein